MGNCCTTKNHENLLINKKWENIKNETHASCPIWLTSKETKEFFTNYRVGAPTHSRWYFEINPHQQTLSIKWDHPHGFCKPADWNNIPYIGYDWIPETTRLPFSAYPENIRIPRLDLMSLRVIDGISKKYEELKNCNH